MVKHLVLWRLKPEAHGQSAAENARAIKEKLEALRGLEARSDRRLVDHDV